MAKFYVTITDEAGISIGETIVTFERADEITVQSVAYAGMQVRRLVDDYWLDEAYKACSRKIEHTGIPSKATPLRAVAENTADIKSREKTG